MPQVPTYGNPQVREQALQGGFQQNIDVSSSTRALGQGLLQVADVADRFVMREAERDAYNAQTAIQSQYLDYQQKYQKERTNDKAKNLLNDVDQWWSQAATNAAKGLNPMSLPGTCTNGAAAALLMPVVLAAFQAMSVALSSC